MNPEQAREEMAPNVYVSFLESEISQVMIENHTLLEQSKRLKVDADFLYCLYACGVNEWEGYKAALEMFESDDP